MKITIIGAGIGGLTTAIALKQKGFEVEIFESTSQFKRAGSGINLAINAMQVYKKLGVYNDIVKLGSYTDSMCVTDHKMNIISKIDLTVSEKKFDVKTVAIHRATLHEILLKRLEGMPIYLGKRLSNIIQNENKVVLSFEDGSTHESDIVIGADGIHSVVRKSSFENSELRFAKQVCWRGISEVDIDKKYQSELNEMWGFGKRFGFVHVDEKTVYWFALANYKNDYKTEFNEVDLPDLFSGFNPVVSKIIGSTDKDDILTNEMIDLKPISSWTNQRICLIGDAAHATTPNLGQGACQAIESAYVIAKCLAENDDYSIAFKKYENIRMKTAVEVVNTSWRIGKIAHLENRVGVKLRNFVMKSIPQKMVQKQSTSILEIDYL